jgi:ABC-type transport system involved in multi-copper enzyme maturation permease subunit
VTSNGGLLPGFGALLGKELDEALRSKRLVIFAVIMTGVCLLVPAFGFANLDHYGSGSRHTVVSDDMHTMLASWAALTGYLGSLMVIASTVDAVSRERATGITAWIVTKPVSRFSYLLAKATAHALVGCVTLVIVPSAVWFAVMALLFAHVPFANVYIAAAILCLEMGFLSAFVVALGVPLRSVTPIAIIALALWFMPTVLPAFNLRWMVYVLPSYLPIEAMLTSGGDMSLHTATIPMAAAIAGLLTFAGAVIMFERQEL